MSENSGSAWNAAQTVCLPPSDADRRLREALEEVGDSVRPLLDRTLKSLVIGSTGSTTRPTGHDEGHR